MQNNFQRRKVRQAYLLKFWIRCNFLCLRNSLISTRVATKKETCLTIHGCGSLIGVKDVKLLESLALSFVEFMRGEALA